MFQAIFVSPFLNIYSWKYSILDITKLAHDLVTWVIFIEQRPFRMSYLQVIGDGEFEYTDDEELSLHNFYK